MTDALEEFARTAGMVLVRVSKREWGEPWGYKTKDFPNCCVCGFATKQEAREHWAASTFGERAAKALLKLLEPK